MIKLFKILYLMCILMLIVFELIQCEKLSADNLKKPVSKPTAMPTTMKPSGNLSGKRIVSFAKEPAPLYSFAAWDAKGKICLLAKFDAMFTITYETNYGKQQLITTLPMDAEMKGRCSNALDANPVLDITWKGGFLYRLVFEKYKEYDTWGIKSMDFVYNTGDTSFDGVVSGREKVAKVTDERVLALFETPIGKSYLCPSPEVLKLYDEKDEETVIIRLTNVQIEAFDINSGKFSPVLRCGQVGFGSGVPAPFGMQPGESNGVTVICGTITIICAILTVTGYAVYRSFFVKRVDYDDMI